jgi:hypothetical protein
MRPELPSVVSAATFARESDLFISPSIETPTFGGIESNIDEQQFYKNT